MSPYNRLVELGSVVALGVYAYAVMSNHLHVVIRLDPAVAWSWSAEEVASRWATVFPVRVDGEVDEQARAQSKSQSRTSTKSGAIEDIHQIAGFLQCGRNRGHPPNSRFPTARRGDRWFSRSVPAGKLWA